MAEIKMSSVGQPTEHLASWTDIKIGDKTVGYATAFSYQVTNSVIRTIKAGNKETKPIAGQLSVTLNLRGLVIPKSVLPSTDTVIESITVNNLVFKKCKLTAWNLNVQSGQILIYSEAAFECEDLEHK